MNNSTASDFELARRLATLVAKDYSRDLLRLLVMYKDISASEAAARLELHVKTAQDFLEGLHQAGIVDRREAAEKKRPYFRYSLLKHRLDISVDLDTLYDAGRHTSQRNWRLRERRDSGALFKEGRGDRISAVHVYEGSGRSRLERRISLTESQGRFLFHLPFPTEAAMSVMDICRRAGITADRLPEVLDLIETLRTHQVVEIEQGIDSKSDSG